MSSSMFIERPVFRHQLVNSLEVLAGIGCFALIFIRLGWRLLMAMLYIRGFTCAGRLAQTEAQEPFYGAKSS